MAVAQAPRAPSVGLSTEEAQRRLAEAGPNVLARPRRPSHVRRFAANLVHLFALLLWAGAALAWLGGLPQLSAAIVAVVLVNAVFAFVLRYFPTQFEFITNQLDAFRASTLSVGVAGTLGLVWGALGFFGAISTAVNYAWGVEKQLSFWKHKLFSFVMLLVAGLLLLVALLLISASQVVGASWFREILVRSPGLAFLRGLTVRYATTLLFIVVVGCVYYFVPNAKVRFRDVWIGALVTGLLWKGALDGFSWYVRDMSRFTEVNGSVGVVVVFLVWVYVQAVILLYGVEFTAAYARLRRGRPDEVPAAPSPRT